MKSDAQKEKVSSRRWAHRSIYLLTVSLVLLCLEGAIVTFVLPRLMPMFTDGRKLPEITSVMLQAVRDPETILIGAGVVAATLIAKEFVLQPRTRWAINLAVLLVLLGLAIAAVFGMMLPIIDIMHDIQS